MPKIFISYRREDSQDFTGRLHDKLVDHFGETNVFFDVDSIPTGVDFRKHLDREVSRNSPEQSRPRDDFCEQSRPRDDF